MKDPIKPDKRRKYDAAFHAEALRLAEQSRSTQAAVRALNIDPKRTPQLHIVPGSAHLTNLEAPEIVNELLLHFRVFCSTQSGVG